MLIDLVAYLEHNAGLQAAGITEVFPLLVPQGAAMPAICYKQNNHEFDYAMDGETKYHRVDITFACGDTTYAGVSAVGNALISALTGYRGTMGATQIYSIFVKDEADNLIIADANEEARVYGKEIDAEITYGG